MDLYIHYQSLPQGKTLADIVGELSEVLEDHGRPDAVRGDMCKVEGD